MTGRGAIARRLLVCGAMIAAAPCAPLRAQSTADVLLLDAPQRSPLYTRYQQPATPAERSAIPHGTPLRVLRARETFADGFTAAMRVEIDGEIWFLLTPAGEKRAPGTFYRGVKWFSDTVKVLPAGTLFHRYFDSGARTYARRITPPGKFQWLSLPAPSREKTWRTFSPTASHPGGIDASVEKKLSARIDLANRRLRDLYEQLSSTEHQRREPPQWRTSRVGRNFLYELDKESAAYAGSTQYLAKDIRNLVLGLTVDVQVAPGRIELTPR